MKIYLLKYFKYQTQILMTILKIIFFVFDFLLSILIDFLIHNFIDLILLIFYLGFALLVLNYLSIQLKFN